MNLLGLEPIIAAIVITVVGIVIQVGLGIIRSVEPFDYKKVLASVIISVFTAFTIVIPILTALPDDMSELLQLATFVSTIATVAGIDTLVKNTSKLVANRK